MIILLVALSVICAALLGYGLAYRQAQRSSQQLAALLISLREGDYTLRAALRRGLLRDAYAVFNSLANQLSGDRQAGIESDALLGKLLGALNIAIFIIGPHGSITGGNEAASTLLGLDGPDDLIGLMPPNFCIQSELTLHGPVRVEAQLPGGAGPWEIRSIKFRRGGKPHILLVVNDISVVLRGEERRIWRSLIRVISHETANSLAPMQATAETLNKNFSSMPAETIHNGLSLIERRARSLTSFIRRYAEFARLPPPSFETFELNQLLHRVVNLETRVEVVATFGPPCEIMADPVQIEQALINLVRNAADASLETQGSVYLNSKITSNGIDIIILDEGPGLPESANLFVPGFTTKSGGSGIGLVLAREIITAHGGQLQLLNRPDKQGAIAKIFLPAPIA